LPRKALIISHPKRRPLSAITRQRVILRHQKTYTTTPGKALIISHLIGQTVLNLTPKRTPELKPNYIILINPRKPTIVPKVSLSKRPAFT